MNSPPLISSEIFFNNIISFDVSLFVLFLSNFVSFISLLSLFFISIKFCSFLLSNKISFNSYTSSFTLLSFLVLELFSVFSVILFLIPKVALSNLIIVLFLSSSSLFLYLFSLCSSPYKKFCNLSIDKILVITIFKKEGMALIGKVIECTNCIELDRDDISISSFFSM